ncbi:alpha/beta hydrolase [Actinocrispum sp. NPDC049592]|uniref:alpha/beta fold hydrolase n=1 Tax=Actinocrispum sp. NPDC049592 TaxID=3154835 RepID=UPI003439423D
MTSPFSSFVLRTRTRRPSAMAILVLAAAFVALSVSPAQGAVAAKENRPGKPKPTIVLVHGAWADGSSWTAVIERLQHEGYTVAAIPNNLRSLSGDAANVRAFLQTVTGPIVLVGHSYGGAVITNAATGLPNVKALVYVNAFAPDEGESPLALAGPDSALSADPATVFTFVPATLPPTPTTDLYLKRTTVFTSFADGLTAADKALVAATQRPAAFGGLAETSGVPAWRTIPSWSLVGTKDKIIPYAVQLGMAKKAHATITEYNAGHLGLMSDPRTVSRFIDQAAKAAVPAS